MLLFITLLSVASAADWQQVTTFTGTVDQTTDYFTVPTQEWRLTWSITPDNKYAVFSIFVYEKGENAIYVTNLMGDNDKSGGTTYVHEGAKDYYMKIGTANLKSYNIKIEYDAAAPIPEYPIPVLIILLIAVTTGTAIVARKKQSNAVNNRFS